MHSYRTPVESDACMQAGQVDSKDPKGMPRTVQRRGMATLKGAACTSLTEGKRTTLTMGSKHQGLAQVSHPLELDLQAGQLQCVEKEGDEILRPDATMRTSELQ
jgi:hypothetical protein